MRTSKEGIWDFVFLYVRILYMALTKKDSNSA